MVDDLVEIEGMEFLVHMFLVLYQQSILMIF